MSLISLLLLTGLLPYLALSASVKVGIVNGTEAKPHSRPYMVSVQRNGKHTCGGFLVSQNFVMTAAHCWQYGENLTVVLGAHDLSKRSTSIEVKFYHVCPANSGLLNDIMLLQLVGAVQKSKKIKWIRLLGRKKKIQPNSVCSIAGWGRTSNEGNRSMTLLEADVNILDKRICKKKWKEIYQKKSMICTGGHGGFCKGDSGGPLVCNNTAVGVVSFFANDCDQLIKPNVYTKISASMPWIKGIINSVN